MDSSTITVEDDGEENMHLMYPEPDLENELAKCAETIADLRNQLEEAREELRTTQAKKKKLAKRVLEAVSCSICLEPFQKAMMYVPCGHSFCNACGIKALCPICRDLRLPMRQRNYTMDSAADEVVSAIEEAE